MTTPGAQLDEQIASLQRETSELRVQVPADEQRPGMLDAVRDLGLVPDDPTVDNGAILTEAIRTGKVNGTVYFPGGAYYAKSTANDCSKTGIAFLGQGLATWDEHKGNYIHQSTKLPQRLGNASVRWVYEGPTDQPAWKITGNGTRIVGINVWRGWNRTTLEKAGTVGVEFNHAGAQNGQWVVDHLAVCGFDVGFLFAGGDQVDVSNFGLLVFISNKTDIKSVNKQSTCMNFSHIKSYGPGERVFEISAGGSWLVGQIDLTSKRTVFDFSRTASNSASYTVNFLKADNAAAGWRLVRHTGPGPVCLRVLSGEIGNNATPAADWIDVPALPPYKRLVEATLWPMGPTVVGGY